VLNYGWPHTKKSPPPPTPNKNKASLDPSTVSAIIVDHANKLGAAKIIMAAHPHSKVAVFFGASVVSHCQAHAPCPVAALREADVAAAAL
jgi:hypothetical protein